MKISVYFTEKKDVRPLISLLIFNLFFSSIWADWLKSPSLDERLKGLEPYRFVNIEAYYDFEEEKLRCQGSPLFFKPEDISQREWEEVKSSLSERKEIALSECSGVIERRTYHKKVKDRGGACVKIFISKHGDVPLQEDDQEKCRYTVTTDTLSAFPATRRFYQEELKKTCHQLMRCLGVLNENSVDTIEDVISVVVHHLENNTNSKEDINSLDDVSAIRESRVRIQAIKDSMESCREHYPEVDDLLANDLKFLSKTLERDISVFHWFPALKGFMVGAAHKSPESMKARAYANYMQGLFYDETNTDDRVGQGLYAASDPNITSEYGSKLLKIDLSKGMRYLDLRNSQDGFTISEATMLALKDLGCDRFIKVEQDMEFQKKRGDVTLYMGRKSMLYNKKECRDVFNRVIQREGYHFLSYDFGNYKPDFCDLTGSTPAAFVLFNIPITKETVDLYDHNFKEQRVFMSPSEEEVEKYRRLSIIRKDINLENEIGTKEREEYIKAWKERLYNCDEQFDDQPSLSPIKNY